MNEVLVDDKKMIDQFNIDLELAQKAYDNKEVMDLKSKNVKKIWTIIRNADKEWAFDDEQIKFIIDCPNRCDFLAVFHEYNSEAYADIPLSTQDWEDENYYFDYNLEDSKEQKVEKFENKYETITLKSRYSSKKTITALMSTKKNGVEYKINFIATAKTIGACKTLIVKYINEKIHKNGYKKITIEAKYDGILSTKFSEVDEFSSPIRKAWKN